VNFRRSDRGRRLRRVQAGDGELKPGTKCFGLSGPGPLVILSPEPRLSGTPKPQIVIPFGYPNSELDETISSNSR
jgi:hypothetical protein